MTSMIKVMVQRAIVRLIKKVIDLLEFRYFPSVFVKTLTSLSIKKIVPAKNPIKAKLVRTRFSLRIAKKAVVITAIVDGIIKHM